MRLQDRYITYRIAGKFDGESNLAVWVETAKLKSANIIFACNMLTRNDVMHAVALLAPPAPLYAAVHVYVASSALAHCQLYFL